MNQFRIVLLGPPGSGKSVTTAMLCQKHELIHISTGNIFKEEVRHRTDLGKKIEDTIAAGDLVSDEIVNEVVFQKIASSEKGFILDGYPRTLQQAESLDLWLEKRGEPLTDIISLSVPEEILIKRIAGRLTCTECGFSSKQSEYDEGDLCPRCSNPLIVRDDDKIDILKHRFVNYRKKTAPLKEYYRNLLKIVDGTDTVEEVVEKVEEVL